MGLLSSRRTTNQTQTTINNNDRRNAVEGGIGVSGDGNSTTFVSNTNSTDVVRAIAELNTETFRDLGGAIVDLQATASDSNLQAWDATLEAGSALVDRILDQTQGLAEAGASLGQSAISAYQPNENKNAQVVLWLGLAVAAAIAAGTIFKVK
jgi:hypothetical protein